MSSRVPSDRETRIDAMRLANPMLDSDTAREIMEKVPEGDRRTELLGISSQIGAQNPMFDQSAGPSTSLFPPQPQPPALPPRPKPPAGERRMTGDSGQMTGDSGHMTGDSGHMTMSPASGNSYNHDTLNPPLRPLRAADRRRTEAPPSSSYVQEREVAAHISEQRRRCAHVEGALHVTRQQFTQISLEVKRAQIYLAGMTNGSRPITKDDLYEVQADVLQHDERIALLKEMLERRGGQSRHATLLPQAPLPPTENMLETSGEFVNWQCQCCTFANHYGLGHCEMCDTRRGEDSPDNQGDTPSTSAPNPPQRPTRLDMPTAGGEDKKEETPHDGHTHVHHGEGKFNCYCCPADGGGAPHKEGSCATTSSTTTTPNSGEDPWEMVDGTTIPSPPQSRPRVTKRKRSTAKSKGNHSVELLLSSAMGMATPGAPHRLHDRSPTKHKTPRTPR